MRPLVPFPVHLQNPVRTVFKGLHNALQIPRVALTVVLPHCHRLRRVNQELSRKAQPFTPFVILHEFIHIPDFHAHSIQRIFVVIKSIHHQPVPCINRRFLPRLKAKLPAEILSSESKPTYQRVSCNFRQLHNPFHAFYEGNQFFPLQMFLIILQKRRILKFGKHEARKSKAAQRFYFPVKSFSGI